MAIRPGVLKAERLDRCRLHGRASNSRAYRIDETDDANDANEPGFRSPERARPRRKDPAARDRTAESTTFHALIAILGRSTRL
jgi:hypothetical protein